MPTRSYRLTIDAVLGTRRQLTPNERLKLRRGIILFLNREYRMPLALANASDGTLELTGPGYFSDPAHRRNV